MTIEMEYEDGSTVAHGVLAIFTRNDYTYAALVPLQEDGTPADAEVSIYACEFDETGENYDLYEIEDEDEYNEAAEAFDSVVAAVV